MIEDNKKNTNTSSERLTLLDRIKEARKQREAKTEDSPSIGGLTAYYALKVAYNLPVIGPLAKNGHIRDILNDYEHEWKCPDAFKWDIIDMGRFKAELIKPKDWDSMEAEETEEAKKSEDSDAKAYMAKKRMILQLHGGGYFTKLHNAYRDVAVEYSKRAKGAAVLCPDYSTVPFHPYPAALEDAVASYNYILDMGISPENIIIAGDSAGGGLSLALTLYLKDHDMPLPAAVITMSAWTDLTKSGSSYDDNYETDPLFGNTRESLVYSEDYYKNTTPDNPYVSPKFGDFTGFPPVLMQVGEMEMLLSDTTDVAKKMEDTGVKVKSHIYPGMFHVFQLGLNLFPEEKEAWNEIEEYINEIWDI